MEQVTQQNAELVEQAATAAEGMQLQAARLVQLVDAFKLVTGRQAAPGGAAHGNARRPQIVAAKGTGSVPTQHRPKRARIAVQ